MARKKNRSSRSNSLLKTEKNKKNSQHDVPSPSPSNLPSSVVNKSVASKDVSKLEIKPRIDIDIHFSNSFYVLNQEIRRTPAPSRFAPRKKPSQIHFMNLTSYLQFIEILKDVVGPDSFYCYARPIALGVQVNSSDKWRILSRYALDNKMEFFTHSLREDKNFRVVIRNLNHSLPVDCIKSELASHGHKCVNVVNIRGKKNKKPRSLFYVDLFPQNNNKDIFNLKILCSCEIKVEEPYRKKNVVQCVRCQRPGHTKNFCNMPARCVKCAGDHYTLACPEPKRVPEGMLKCVLCDEKGHASSWRGCPVLLKANARCLTAKKSSSR